MKRFFGVILFFITITLVLAACGAEELECEDAIGCVEVAPDDPITLSSSLVISGPNTELGLDSQHGVDLAVDFRGDVLDHSVLVLHEDDGCNAEGGQTSATKIVSNPEIIAMIGTSCSGAAVPAAQIISDAGYAMVSPSNTAVALTDPDLSWRIGYLRTAHNDKVQGPAMADFAYNVLGVRKAAAIHDGDPYTSGLAQVFVDGFEELGGEIVAFEAEAADATNVEPLLTTIAASEPEFIFYPLFIPLGSLVTNTVHDIPGLEDVIIAAADGMQSPSFYENTVGTHNGMYLSGPDLSFSNIFYEDEFLPAYRDKFGTDPTAPFHAHSYDATMIILDAIEEVAQVADDGTLLIGRQDLRDALYATSGFVGVTGILTCDDVGDCAFPQIAVSVLNDSALEVIWP